VDGKYAYSFTGSGDTTPINGFFRMLNLATGATAATVVDPVYNWSGYTMNSAVVLGEHHDAFAINGGRLISWDTALDASHTPHIAWDKTASFKGEPVLANSKIYAIDGDDLDVLDESTGNLLWKWSSAGHPLTTTIIVTDNVAFVGTATTTYAVDLGLHTSNWSYPASGILALSDNTLYIGTSDGVVDAIVAPEPSALSVLAVLGTFLFRRSRRKPCTNQPS
jgi:outer membrane protein assembly factor BamB